MKLRGFLLGGILLLSLLVVGIVSLVDTDPTVSMEENRKLATKPEFSFESLFKGNYISDLENYYADTFPMRDRFTRANKQLNGFYHYSSKSEEGTMLLIDASSGAEQGGMSLADFESARAEASSGKDKPQEQTPQVQPDQPAGPENGDVPDVNTEPDTPDEPVVEPEPEVDIMDEVDANAAHDSGWVQNDNADYQTLGAVTIIGTQAMEIPTMVPDVIASYAQVVNDMAEKMPDIQVYSLVTPNAAEFYSPLDFHTGSHSQKKMIDTL
ncbi:MAG: hypothetical protein J6P31_05605, partial [Oscillospiraceae bacterium]|nr:hypothetical protein [Oscillospiraceae bacterium]